MESSRIVNVKQRPRGANEKNTKLGHKGVWPRSRDLLLNFGTPLLSPVRMKIQTSNFAAGSRMRNTKQKSEKLGQKGRGLGHVSNFLILGPPYYLRFGWSYRRHVLQPDRGWGILSKKWKIGPKGAWPSSRDLLLNFVTPLLSPVRQVLQPDRGWGMLNKKMKNWAKSDVA